MCDDNTDNDEEGAAIACGLEEEGSTVDSDLEVLVGTVLVDVLVPTFGPVLLILPLFDLCGEEDNIGPDNGGVLPLGNNGSGGNTGLDSVHICVDCVPVSWLYVSAEPMP